jgi:hypothetical protein
VYILVALGLFLTAAAGKERRTDMSIGILERWERTGRDTRWCEFEGCVKATNGRKPYCTVHMIEMPYVREVQERIQAREAEWGRVERGGSRAVDVEGVTAQEILEYARFQGPCTVRRLSKDLNISRGLLDPYMKSLHRHGRIKLTANKRGVPVVHIVEVSVPPAPEVQAA